MGDDRRGHWSSRRDGALPRCLKVKPLTSHSPQIWCGCEDSQPMRARTRNRPVWFCGKCKLLTHPPKWWTAAMEAGAK